MDLKSKQVMADLRLEKATATRSAHLHITDRASGLEFASIELHPGALEALLLKGEVTCELTAYGIGKYLGATKIVESRTVPYYGSTGDDQGTIEKWVAENKKEEGWFVDPHVRPIDIQLLGGQLHITYHVYKFVKP